METSVKNRIFHTQEWEIIMKIFFYALREYDEKKYVEKFAEQYSFEYGFTSDYPSMDNVELAEGYDAISIITNPMYPGNT